MRKLTLLSVLIVLAVTATMSQQPKTAVTVDGAGSARLGSGTDREIRVAVTAVDSFQVLISPSIEQPLIVEASFNNVRSSDLQAQFTPTWELSGATPLALKIAVSAKVTQPGKYSLILSLRPKSQPTAPRLPLDIEQPAGDLDLPAKLTIRRTDYWPFCSTTETMPLNVRESTRSTAITNLNAAWRPDTLATGSIQVTLPTPADISKQCVSSALLNAATLPAGCELKNVGYKLDGDFPLGVVNGNLRFFGDQLTAPKALPVEIQSRLTRLWPVFAIAAGLGLSLFLKLTLAKRIELNEARVKARQLLDDIARDLARYADEKFHSDLAAKMSDLETATKGTNAATIEAKRALTEQTWRGAVNDLNTRLQVATKSNDDWQVSTASPPALPSMAQTALAAIRTKLGDALECLGNGDATGATRAIAEISAQLLQRFRDAGVTWQQAQLRLVARLRMITPPLPGLPKPVLSEFDQQLTQSPPDLNRLSPQAGATQPQDASTLTESLAVEYSVAQVLLDQLARRLEREWEDFSRDLDLIRSCLSDASQFYGIRDYYFAFLKTLPTAADDPVTVVNGLDSLRDLQSRWKAAFVANYPAGDVTEIDKLVEQQEFVQALVKLEEKVKPTTARILGDDGESSKAGRVSWPSFAALNLTPTISVVQTSPWMSIGEPGRYPSARPTPENELQRDKLTQTAIIAILLLGYIFMSSTQTYSGTWNDVWNMFLAALTADFALDSVLGKFKVKS